MEPQLQALHHQLDTFARREDGIEFWFARDLMSPLGYSRWENFAVAVNKAIESCKSTGYDVSDHFRGVTKMVALGSGAEREIEDFMCTHHCGEESCYRND